MAIKSIPLLAAILLCCKIFFGQTAFPYSRSWKKIDSLIRIKGLPKSALKEVNKLYTAAKKEKRDDQWVKAVVYRRQLEEKEEAEISVSVQALEKEIQLAPPRVAALLKSLEAEDIFNYLQQQRYRLSGRTEARNDTSADISTWTAGELNKKIRTLYLGSLEEEILLQKTSLDSFGVDILKGNTRDLRPSLYDLLAYRALDYFQYDDPEQPAAEDTFLMDNRAILLPSRQFMTYLFPSASGKTNHLTALMLFQKLLRFHSRDVRPDAEVDADINRIAFVNRYGVLPGKDSLYFNALQQITDQYASLPAAAQAWYLQAAVFSERAASYDPVTDTAHQYDYRRAKAICEAVVKQKDSSEGRSNCYALLQNIVRKTFRLQTEKVNLPDLPFRTLVSYKNVNHLYGRIIRIDDATRDALGSNGWEPELWRRLTRFPVLKSFDQALPETNDFQEHRVEIKVNALPPGQYALFTSSDSAFSEQAVLAVQYFFCSSIAFINHGLDYFVADRNTGAPLAGVTVQSLNHVYDSRQQKNIYRKSKTYKTDQHGYFHLDSDKHTRYDETRLEFYSGKDYLSFSAERIYSANSSDEYGNSESVAYRKRMTKDILFTDRAIYRPGQTVYYKGLLVTRDFVSKRYKVAGGVKSKLYLTDVNDQRVDSVPVLANDFGSFHGLFILPDNLLNGGFHILDSLTGDNVEIAVEEYKRPGFYIAFNPVKGNYRIGDSIHVSGFAKAYAGNAITGSPVSYRVFREPRFSYPWYFGRPPVSAEQEIRHGETITDASGSFDIIFPAMPDEHIRKESEPVFIYRVETNITDLNGETRLAATSLAASYQSFQIVSSFPEESRMASDSLKQIAVTTKNASGAFLPEQLTVTVYRLKAPQRLIRKRYWEQPDQFVMSKQEYEQNFPDDEYKDETNKDFWEKQSVFEKTDSTNATGLFPLFTEPKYTGRHLPSGWYLFEFKARDKTGEWITDKRYIELSTEDEHTPAYTTYNAIVSEDETGEPGTELRISTGSSVPDVFVIRSMESMNSAAARYSFYNLNNQIKTTTLKIEEKDRGGFAVNDIFIKNNRWYSSTHIIHVPWSNKELQFSYETWRNKLLPGSAEKWKIRINGDKKDRVASEVMTAMYDASLDQFKTQAWNIPDLYPVFSAENSWNGSGNFDDQISVEKPIRDEGSSGFFKRYDRLGFLIPGNRYITANRMMFDVALASPQSDKNSSESKVEVSGFGYAGRRKNEQTDRQDSGEPDPSGVQIRKNFNETAFFFPDLKTDAEGNVEISFTMPEALTQWKWMIFAHSRDLAFGYAEKRVVTQKELMLQPDMPRFFRQGDSMQLPVKISNLSDSVMTGTVRLDWIDAGSGSNQNQAFENMTNSQPFRVEAGQSTMVNFSSVIPDNLQQPVVYRIQAKTNTGFASDGEEGLIPVLSNRMLVIETFPLNMGDSNKRLFIWTKLLNSKTGSTLKNQSLTLEFTSNPAWYAVQALPYLMEFPYECAEQTFNRFYANALAAQIVKSAPEIELIFEKWQNKDSAALLSNLQKNEELKSVLLRETPWVLDAQNENQQKKNLALVFDMVKMSKALKSNLEKLKQMQSEGGGFPWFKGGHDDRYITQYIISGIGHLQKLSAVPAAERPALEKITKLAIAFLDKELKSDYDHRPKKAEASISPIQIQYLYMRSFFPETGLPGSVFPAVNYYRKLAIQDWPKQNMYLRGMISLFLFRTGDRKTADDIIHSLKENAIRSEDLGIHWKSVGPGYYWQESPVETQSLLIEAFNEISPDTKMINQMKYWLLQQKHAHQWSSTKSTADACYALLTGTNSWLASAQSAEIRLGSYTVQTSDEKAEAGTGYLKKVIPAKEIEPDMGNIRVTIHHENSGMPVPAWGALYWQYFENLDRITAAQSPLSVSKALYTEKSTASGPVLEPVAAGHALKPGDKLIMRIILKTDRDMEYVHLKDMRAACLEPVNVLSGYHWQGNLGYYEATKDESTSFFFDYLTKGTHVFEYPLFVTTAGAYSNGISTLECMYAPEFAAHTGGLQITVKRK